MIRKKDVHLVVIIMFMGIFLGVNSGLAADTTFHTGLNYEWWSSDKSDHGMQLYIPLQADSKFQDFSFQVLGAYAYTNVNTSNSSSESLSKFTDTKLNLSYELVNKLPVDMLFGLGFNLPTGYTNLREDQLVFIVPPELMDITTFGEGLNINPTLIISTEWAQWVAGMGLGYTVRGKYDYSFDLHSYDPGDIFNINLEVGHDLTPDLYGRVFGEYLTFTKDKVQGEELYQEGNVVLVGLGTKYKQSVWTLDCTLQGILRDKSKVQEEGAERIAAENHNSHGNELIGDITYTRSLDEKSSVNALLQVLWIGNNDYASDSPFYIGKRQKTTLGVGYTRSLQSNVKCSLDLKGFTMDDKRNIYHPDEDLKFKGVSIAGTVSVGL
jgi:hypothetical protein